LSGGNSLHAAAIIGDEEILHLVMPKIKDLEVRNHARETALDITSRSPSVDDLQYPKNFRGWKSTDSEEATIRMISEGRVRCHEIISRELARRTAYQTTFIRHSLVEDQLNRSKLRDIFHHNRNFAERRFYSQLALPFVHTPLEWSYTVKAVYETQPSLVRELDIRLYSMDLTNRVINAGFRNVVELKLNEDKTNIIVQNKDWELVMKKIVSTADIIRSRK
jgi:hypothetical protein